VSYNIISLYNNEAGCWLCKNNSMLDGNNIIKSLLTLYFYYINAFQTFFLSKTSITTSMASMRMHSVDRERNFVVLYMRHFLKKLS
jgi:hypothetical protein